MSTREQERAWILTKILKGELAMAEGALRLGLSERQLWRLRVAFERDGPAGLVHGNRGRPSGRRLDGSLRARVIDLRRTRYADVNDTHLAELLAQCRYTSGACRRAPDAGRIGECGIARETHRSWSALVRAG